jgi:hypothetical protein
MQDVSGLNGAVGEGEERWPRIGTKAPDPDPAWPLVDVADKGPDEGNWVKL